ncbi:MAG: Gfo/Idh/MocA family oxidoreductase [Opitutaceae bacterium]|nr:Gfo/Idh/MocA family oxidoreductase [Opitutaceae bacterium]MBP9913063.1 Gfo/Idh/MocA family oxidoreductase [Opitutaceae bacterium]
MTPTRIGIIGLGGFAGWHHTTVAGLEARGLAKLICTCDPQAASFSTEQQTWNFTARGVSVFSDYKAMLAACHRDLDLLVVPTPINLHAEMHKAAVALGIPVYLEKPPTLDYLELEDMIVRDQQARKSSLVGFNFIIEQPRRALKQRILAGEFGAVTGGALMAQWPRPADYFKRNNWAGRLMMDDRVVLDSCFGNANAHFVHNLLFWLGGPELSSWAGIATVRAELYRAHAIEGADTFFVEADTTTGVTLRIANTHACAGQTTHCETVTCEKAEIRYIVGQQAEVRWLDGRVERIELGHFDGLTENHLEYHRYLRGETSRPATSLVDARPFVVLNNLAHVSSGRITAFPPESLTGVRNEKDQKDYFNVAGMAGAIERFLQRGEWPGPNGWNRATGGSATPADLPRFHDTVRAMLAAR